MPKKKLPAALAKFAKRRQEAIKKGEKSFTYKNKAGVVKRYKRVENKKKGGIVLFKAV